MKPIFLIVFFLLCFLQVHAFQGEALQVSAKDKNQVFDLISYIALANDPKADLTFQTVASTPFRDKFRPLSETQNQHTPVQWLRISIQNRDEKKLEFNLSFTFTDYIQFFSSNADGTYQVSQTGDLIPLAERKVKVGQMVFVPIEIPAHNIGTYYVRLESITPISMQSRSMALHSIKLYSPAGFDNLFDVRHRIYQAFFYGAVLIMLLYNLLIFFILKDKSYLIYVLFIAFLMVFFASNSGYIHELFLEKEPRLDLYIRFLSPPVLLFTYLLFSKVYLKPCQHAPGFNKWINAFLVMYLLIIAGMLTGQWVLGRNITVVFAILSFVFIFFFALATLKRGYKPALYFLLANILLLVGGILYACQRFYFVEQTAYTQYSLQIASVLQICLFSIGLAARIHLVQQALSEQTVENERLERQKEMELKIMMEEKNIELENKVRKRTAEVVQQKEEITVQNEVLAFNYQQLEKAQKTIEMQYKKLSLVNVTLEKIVRQRTRELKISNDELLKSNQDLDMFIYRTAHDIRGPLARLIGLSNLGLMEVQDNQALEYLQKLNTEANYLSYLLSRLSVVHEINHAEIKLEKIAADQLIADILSKVSYMNGSQDVQVDILEGKHLQFYSDYKIISFIITNLIENAIRFSRKERDSFIKIHFSILNKNLLISIIDNGVGITDKEAPGIFSLFSPAAGKYKTAGMGLYMAKISAEKLHGKLILARNQPHFTHFQVQIPLLS